MFLRFLQHTTKNLSRAKVGKKEIFNSIGKFEKEVANGKKEIFQSLQ